MSIKGKHVVIKRYYDGKEITSAKSQLNKNFSDYIFLYIF